MWFLRLLVCAILLPLVPAATGAAERPACPGCNVLLVTFDSLRADRLGAYGYGKPTSPALDEFAQRSTVYLRNVSQSGSTIASIPSLLTGRYPHSDRLLDDGHLRPSEQTLAEILSERGYQTMAVIGHKFAGCQWGFCAGFDRTDMDYSAPESGAGTLARAVKMLRSHEGDEPFFLWVHFRVPHSPYDPPPEFFRLFYDGPKGAPQFYGGKLEKLPYPAQIASLRSTYAKRGEPVTRYQALGGQLDLTPSVVEQFGALYDGNVRMADEAFAGLLAALTADQSRETLIIVAADHGESLGENQRIGHNALFESVIHTPLIVHVPGLDGRQVDAPTMNVDLLPTALSALGAKAPDGIRGTDLLAGPPPADRPVFAEYSRGQVLRRGKWKLHRNKHRTQLVDLAADPSEQLDTSALNPKVVAELTSLLDGVRAAAASDSTPEDTAVLEKLRALGYIRDGRPADEEMGLRPSDP